MGEAIRQLAQIKIPKFVQNAQGDSRVVTCEFCTNRPQCFCAKRQNEKNLNFSIDNPFCLWYNMHRG